MKQLTFLVKPASGLCDLRCRYCFYEDVSQCRAVRHMGRMEERTAENLLRAAIAAVEPGDMVQFIFQGGEPTLAGLDFFREFVRLEGALCPPGLTIHHAIQTNGMTLDRAWADFFREHQVLVGLSLDGAREFHDALRVDPQGKGTWSRAVRALALLDKAGVETNLLCVVTSQLARSPQKVYQSLNKLGNHPLQFIPCLDPLQGPRGGMPYSLSPQRYGRFLCGLFDLWYRDWQGGHYTSIRLFDDYLRILAGMAPSTCAASGACGSYLVVEGDGSLYPCDFFVLDQWYIGNINRMTVEQAMDHPKSRQFLAESHIRPQTCAGCPYQSLCRGGCPRDWTERGPQAENYYCPAFRQFFDYALPRLRQAAAALRGTHR